MIHVRKVLEVVIELLFNLEDNLDLGCFWKIDLLVVSTCIV